MAAPLIGILDSGAGPDQLPLVDHGRSFAAGGDGEVQVTDDFADLLGHGTEVIEAIRERAPVLRLAVARVFHENFASQPRTVAAGLDWLVAGGARLVNMSFGLTEDRVVLKESCRRAVAAGAILVAAAPALGKRSYPAAYDSVIAVTGDARCARGVISDLGGDRADFGTFCGTPEPTGGRPVVAGASLAAAHFSGLAAAILADNPTADREGIVDHFRGSSTMGEDPRRWR